MSRSDTIYVRRTGTTGNVETAATALGVKRVNFNPAVISGTVAPATQVLYAIALPTVSGETYTGVSVQVSVAGSGTPPTGFFVGLATSGVIGATGSMLAQSSNLASSSALTTSGYQQLPFSTPYGEGTTGLRMVVILENGTWGTTQMLLGRNVVGNPTAGFGFFQTAGGSQTALPANGSNLPSAYTSSNSAGFWVSLY